MANNAQSRKWMMTINNAVEYGFNHDVIIENAKQFMPDYFCLADEIATTGTFHTHLYIYSKSPMRFSTLKARFPVAHIDKAYGSSQENRDYIRKEGKWAEDVKSETKIEGSFYEWGTMPTEAEEKATKQSALISAIDEGKTTAEIITEKPEYALKVREVETLRQVLIAEKRGSEFRNVETVYLWGASGVGKTRSIYMQFPVNEIFRMTSYRKNQVLFDGYNGEDVLVFEEFHSSVSIGEMLNYLDIYPLRLLARYSDKIALYSKVFITSNIPLEQQYVDVQRRSPEVWTAFLRRIQKVIRFNADGSKEETIINGKKEIRTKGDDIY